MRDECSFDICRELWRIEHSNTLSLSTVISLIKGVNTIFRENHEHYKTMIVDAAGVRKVVYKRWADFIKNYLTSGESKTPIKELREWDEYESQIFIYDLCHDIYSHPIDRVFEHLNDCKCSLTHVQMCIIQDAHEEIMTKYFELLKTL